MSLLYEWAGTYRGMPRTAETTRVMATPAKSERIKDISMRPPDPPALLEAAGSLCGRWLVPTGQADAILGLE